MVFILSKINIQILIQRSNNLYQCFQKHQKTSLKLSIIVLNNLKMFGLMLNYYIIQKFHQIFIIYEFYLIQGQCSLYQSQIFNRFRNYYILISAFGGYLTYYSIKKLYNYQDRKFIGILFYLCLLGITLRSMRSVQSQYQRLLISIDLLPCGRKVLIQHPSIYGYCISKQIDIATISRPKDVYQKSIQKMEHVFPVIMDTQLLYLHRDPDFIVNKEILPAVMNAKYIKVD
ncbi:unnamed protein product [Paramecium pentaurelia]|uniref:Transmembrane protein n=1 Tax=Paramecium pentaurelia TaxID=43138 RepID=A0A8S1TA79_9CILI|nr:unnamed protein product [Paramecium pentaurelia]